VLHIGRSKKSRSISKRVAAENAATVLKWAQRGLAAALFMGHRNTPYACVYKCAYTCITAMQSCSSHAGCTCWLTKVLKPADLWSARKSQLATGIFLLSVSILFTLQSRPLRACCTEISYCPRHPPRPAFGYLQEEMGAAEVVRVGTFLVLLLPPKLSVYVPSFGNVSQISLPVHLSDA
jgi:hypothetical protein